MRGGAQIYDVRMAQFVLKIEKLSHIMGPRASQDLRSPSPIMAPGTEYNGISTEYNEESTAYKDISTEYNGISTEYNELITEYNNITTKYNDITTQYNRNKYHKTVLAFHTYPLLLKRTTRKLTKWHSPNKLDAVEGEGKVYFFN